MWMHGVKSEPSSRRPSWLTAALLDRSKGLDKVPHGNVNMAQTWRPSGRPINQEYM